MDCKHTGDTEDDAESEGENGCGARHLPQDARSCKERCKGMEYSARQNKHGLYCDEVLDPGRVFRRSQTL